MSMFKEDKCHNEWALCKRGAANASTDAVLWWPFYCHLVGPAPRATSTCDPGRGNAAKLRPFRRADESVR